MDGDTDRQSDAPATADLADPKRGSPRLRTNPFDPPDADWPITYDSDLVSRPLDDPSFVPALTAEEAVRRATDIGFNAALQPGTPTVVLRSVSAGFEGQDRSFAPHPAWVIIWHDSKLHFHPQLDVRCIYLIVVDARTGEPEAVRQVCGG
jgi:hypothetical protein